jgi:hypothetical protein
VFNCESINSNTIVSGVEEVRGISKGISEMMDGTNKTNKVPAKQDRGTQDYKLLFSKEWILLLTPVQGKYILNQRIYNIINKFISMFLHRPL